MENKWWKAFLYLLPALLFLGVFMVYPLVDVFVYSFEEGYNASSQTFSASAATTTRTCSTIRTFCRRWRTRSCSW